MMMTGKWSTAGCLIEEKARAGEAAPSPSAVYGYCPGSLAHVLPLRYACQWEPSLHRVARGPFRWQGKHGEDGVVDMFD
jgi:hypothetical protein